MSWEHAMYVMSPHRASGNQVCYDCKRNMQSEIMYWNCKRGKTARNICVTCFAVRTLRGIMKHGYLPHNWGRCDNNERNVKT